VKDPTLEEIAERCAEIQATWDEDTRRSRIVDPSRRPDYVYHWVVPVVSIRDLGGEAESALQGVVDIGLDEVLGDIIPTDTTGPFPPGKRTLGSNVDKVKIL
jgi:hypothetical protein